MLLINFFKKASVSSSLFKSGNLLTLFLRVSTKIPSLFLAFFLALIAAHSQEQQYKVADSIIQLAVQQDNDSLAIQQLHKAFFKYCYSEPQIAKSIAIKSIDLSKKIEDDYLLVRGLLRHGIYYDITGKKDSALVVYDDAYKVANRINDLNGKASVYNNKGLIYWNLENYNEAMENYLASLKIFEELGQERGQANNLNNIGLLLVELDRREEAKANYKKALKLREKLKDTYGIGASLSNISKVFSLMQQMDSAIYYSHKAVKLKSKINDQRGLAIAYNNLGLDHRYIKSYDSALYYLKKSDHIYDNLKSTKLKSTNSHALGTVYDRMGDYENAIKYYNQSLETLSDDEVMSIYKTKRSLAYAYKNQQDYIASAAHFEEALQLRDSIADQNEKVATQEVYEKYQSVEKEKQILVQRAEIAEQDLIIQRRNYQLYALLAMVLILSTLGYLFYNQQKLKNRQLQKENELKDALVKIETQNKLHEQRIRISRDLHDNIGAQLTFIISSIDNLKYSFNIKDDKLTSKLDNISSFTSSTIYELRDTIWAMNKTEITFEDLQTRIMNYIDKARLSDDKITFSFEVDESVNTKKAFNAVEGINIHRIIQEAVHNSKKHADATDIKVRIDQAGTQLRFEISDNGKGFVLDNVERGNGLTNMQKRAIEIGGTVTIFTEMKKGTQIKLLI